MIHVKRSRTKSPNDFATLKDQNELRDILRKYNACRRVHGKTGELTLMVGTLFVDVKVYDGNKLMRLHQLQPLLPGGE